MPDPSEQTLPPAIEGEAVKRYSAEEILDCRDSIGRNVHAVCNTVFVQLADYDAMKAERDALQNRLEEATPALVNALQNENEEIIAELSQAREETARVRGHYAEEIAIVDRIWQQLGRDEPIDYKSLKGRSIHDLIDERLSALSQARARLEEVEGQRDVLYSGLRLISIEVLDSSNWCAGFLKLQRIAVEYMSGPQPEDVKRGWMVSEGAANFSQHSQRQQ